MPGTTLRNCGSLEMTAEANPGQDIAFVLSQYALQADTFRVERISSGHINLTYLLTGPSSAFVLQRINSQVFRSPGIVSNNIRLAKEYLAARHPEYLFIAPLPSSGGEYMVFDHAGHPWRLFPYVPNTYTIDTVETVEQAFRASEAFGKLGRLLRGCDVSAFGNTIDRFHDLAWRFEQLEQALSAATDLRKEQAQHEIQTALSYKHLVDRYQQLVTGGSLSIGIFHNDTKINNVLFDRATGNTVAVIDLDTLMPGYFIYDLGDLVRTIVSQVSEEGNDFRQISVRRPFLDAVVDGYLGEMGQCLSGEEKSNVSFAGLMMTYIMALRFLADYLRGDTYYRTTYPGQNLVRAGNQLTLLRQLETQLK